MDVGNNSLRAKGSSPYGRREMYPPIGVQWYTLHGVQCTLRSECGVHSARSVVYPPLGVKCTLRSEGNWRTGELGFTDIISRLRGKSPKTGERCEPAGKLYNLSKTGFRRRLSSCRSRLQKSASTA